MAKYGFVYCLMNESFPDLYKIGCTERSPTQRADELSAASGVPSSYYVVAYIECENPQVVERDIHRRLAQYRPNDCREFFRAPLALIAAHLFHHPENFGYMDRCMRENTEGQTPAWQMEDPYSVRLAA